MSDLGETLLHKRLLIVTGKGGVGKSTIAAALGLAAAGMGLRTIVAELSGQRRVGVLLGGGGPGSAEPKRASRLSCISIDPDQALREYLRLQVGPLGRALMASRAFKYLAAAAPGLSELVTIGKVWELTRDGRVAGKQCGCDLVVVDGPSSGQCLALLRAPSTFAQIAHAGPVAAQAREIAATLAASDLTGALLVTLAEELAVSETIALREQLTRSPSIAIDGVLANQVYLQRFDDRDASRLRNALDASPDPLRRTALRAALSQHARRQAQQRQLARLASAGCRALELPVLPARPPDLAALALLGERLVGSGR